MLAEIKVDVSQAREAAKAFGAGFRRDYMVETIEAIQVGSQAIQSEWLKYVSGVTVTYSGGDFRINRVSGQYASAVMEGLRYPIDGNPLKGGVEVNLDYADKMERGFEEFDIKIGLLASSKAKWTKGKDSHPYIDVPFRHSADDVPASIMAVAKAGGRALGTIRLGKGLGTAQAGIRSKSTDTGGNYTWRTGLYAGLKRQAAGPSGAGQYMTFRRVSANSDPASWINPGAEPKPVSKAIEENLGDSLRSLVEGAFERDILRLSRQAGV